MKGDRIFLDTNVLIYAYDISAGEKNKAAKKTVEELWGSGLGILSAQVLQEFYVCVTRKIQRPLENKTARIIIKDFLSWEVVVNDGNAVLDAIDIQLKHKFSFWDSMIIASAIRANADWLLSEDFADGLALSGVKIHNPFLKKS